MVSEPALGDFNYEHESTNQQTFGTMKFPTVAFASGVGRQFRVRQRQRRTQRIWRELPAGRTEQLRRSRCGSRRGPAGAVRASLRLRSSGLPTASICSGGGPANSIAIEFNKFVAVFEAPTSEARSLAVIEQIARLAPDKPIRYLVNSHQRFDHIGGIRTYLHIRATIVTQRKNIDFLNHDVLNYRARTVSPDMVSLWPRPRSREGYNFEAFNENYVITDGSRILNLYYVQPLRHAEGMAIGYLPAEDRDAGEPVRHARTAAGDADAGDGVVLSNDAHPRPQRDDHRTVHGKPVQWRRLWPRWVRPRRSVRCRGQEARWFGDNVHEEIR